MQTSFWTDPKVRTLPIKAKLLFAYLITSPNSHIAGIYYLPLATISYETNLHQKETAEAMALLIEADVVAYDDDTNTVWIKNMLRYQSRGQKIIRAVEYQLKTLHHSKIIKSFLEHYQELKIPYRYPIDTLSIGVGTCPSPSPSPSPDPSPNLRGEERGGGEKMLPSDESISCAQFLSDKIFENFPKRTAPTEARLVAWAREAEKTHRIDDHSWEDIRELLAWSQADSFWRQNILSMGKFREKWNQLLAKKQTSGRTKADQQRQKTKEFLERKLS